MNFCDFFLESGGRCSGRDQILGQGSDLVFKEQKRTKEQKNSQNKKHNFCKSAWHNVQSMSLLIFYSECRSFLFAIYHSNLFSVP